MNILFRRFVFSVAFICIISSAYCQKPYTSGQFEITVTIGKTDKADIEKFNTLKSNMNRQKETTHYVFNDSLVAHVVLDSFKTIKSRVVYNFNSLEKLKISREQGTLYHNTAKIKAKHLSKHLINGKVDLTKRVLVDYDNVKEENIEGLKVRTLPVNYFMNFTHGDNEYSYTSEVEMPFMKYVRPKAANVIDSNIVVRKRVYRDNRTIWKDYEMINFTSEIKTPEWLDVSVEGIPNISKFRYDPAKDRFSAQNRKRPKKPVMAKIPNASNEVNAVVELMNLNMFSRQYYSGLEKGEKIGRLDILTHTYENKEDENPGISKINALLKVGFISQNDAYFLISALKKNKDWDYKKRKAFCNLFFLKQELKNLDFRRNIIANFEKEGYEFVSENGEELQFYSGAIGIDKMLATDKRIFLTTFSKEIKADPNIFMDEILNVIEPILNAQNIAYTIKRNSKKYYIIIESKGVEYKIDYSYNEHSFNEKEGKLTIDKYMVEYALASLKQLAADQGLEYVYGTHDWLGVLVYGYVLKEDDYNDIISMYPELKLVDDLMYIIGMPKKDFWTEGLSIDVEFHPTEKDNVENEYSFYTMIGVVPAGVDYITTDQKANFLQHIKKFEKEYRIDKDVYDHIEKELAENLFSDIYAVLNLIPSINISLPRFEDESLQIDQKKDDFKDVFPHLDRLIKGDFKAKNLRVDPLSKYLVEMDYNGKRIGVELIGNSVKQSLLKFLNDQLETKGTGIYKFQRLASYNTTYIYLSNDQRDSLEEIFDFRLKKMK